MRIQQIRPNRQRGILRLARPPRACAWGWFALLVLSLSASATFAQDSRPGVVAVELLTGRSTKGTLVSLSEERLQIRGTSIESIDRGQVFRVDFPSARSAKTQAAGIVYLSNGDRLAIAVTKSDGEDLHGVWSGLRGQPAVKVPLLYVRGFIASGKSMRNDNPAAVFRPNQKLDLLLLKNGDRVTGRVKTLDAKWVTLEKLATKIDRQGIRALAFDPRFLDQPKRPEERALVRLRDGTRMTASRVALKPGGALQIQTTFGASVAVPVSAVASLQFLGKRVVALSDIKPAGYRYTPFIAGRQSLRNNRNALGGPLLLRGREFAIGLGTRTRSRIDYDLKGDERLFRATVGVDDAAQGRGSVIFRIDIDGKTVFTSPQQTGKSPPLAIPAVKLTGAKRLSLIADFGSHGDLLDYANWCDAVLVR